MCASQPLARPELDPLCLGRGLGKPGCASTNHARGSATRGRWTDKEAVGLTSHERDNANRIGRAKRWAGLAIAVGSRLAAVPRSLAQMPNEVWQKLASRGTTISPDALYDLIPAGVKTGTDDVLAFLGKRDLSHIKSKHRRPDLANDPTNVLFEKRWWNRRRGSRNMKRWEVTRARLDNFAEGVVKGARATTVAAAKGAILGALMELPVSAAENLVLVRGRGKSRKEAWTDVARDVGRSAVTGAAGTVVATGIAMIGVPMAPAVAVPIAVVGSTLYTWSAAERVWKARARVGSADPPVLARGFDPDSAPDLSTDGWPEKFAKAPVLRGLPSDGATENIFPHPVVPARYGER